MYEYLQQEGHVRLVRLKARRQHVSSLQDRSQFSCQRRIADVNLVEEERRAREGGGVSACAVMGAPAWYISTGYTASSEGLRQVGCGRNAQGASRWHMRTVSLYRPQLVSGLV